MELEVKLVSLVQGGFLLSRDNLELLFEYLCKGLSTRGGAIH